METSPSAPRLAWMRFYWPTLVNVVLVLLLVALHSFWPDPSIALREQNRRLQAQLQDRTRQAQEKEPHSADLAGQPQEQARPLPAPAQPLQEQGQEKDQEQGQEMQKLTALEEAIKPAFSIYILWLAAAERADGTPVVLVQAYLRNDGQRSIARAWGLHSGRALLTGFVAPHDPGERVTDVHDGERFTLRFPRREEQRPPITTCTYHHGDTLAEQTAIHGVDTLTGRTGMLIFRDSTPQGDLGSRQHYVLEVQDLQGTKYTSLNYVSPIGILPQVAPIPEDIRPFTCQ